jgi:aldose sugar dehydrogenase
LTCHHCPDRLGCVFLLLCSTIFTVSISEANSQIALATENIDQPSIRDNKLNVQVVFEGLEFPSSMAFLGPDDILVLEKNEGTVKRIVDGVMMPEPLLKIDVSTLSERGMLGTAVAKDETSHIFPYVFLYYTVPSISADPIMKGDENFNIKASNQVYRYELVENKLVNPQLLLRLPSLNEVVHNGGVLLFGPENNLYVSSGSVAGDNKGKPEIDDTKTQNLNDGPDPDGRGGILRLSQDGRGVHGDDNDYVLSNEYPANLYYAYGIRNSFGMDFDPETGFLWDTENHATGSDEINLVKPGFNSGWRQVKGLATLDEGFDSEKLVDFEGRGKYSDPEFVWKKAVGPTALRFFDSYAYGKNYHNDMFVADFHNGNIYHFKLNHERTELELSGGLRDKIAENTDELENVIFGQGFGGITDLEVGSDGHLYVLSLRTGGSNCSPSETSSDKNCVEYDSEVQGVIFRIDPN